MEINKAIDLGHRNLETGITSKLESVRGSSEALL